MNSTQTANQFVSGFPVGTVIKIAMPHVKSAADAQLFAIASNGEEWRVRTKTGGYLFSVGWPTVCECGNCEDFA